MSSLTQGVLSNNSVTPDVNIEEFQKNYSREQLKHAINKSFVNSNRNQIPLPTVGKINHKRLQNVQLKLTGKKNNSSSDNQFAMELAKISNKLESLERNSKLLEDKQKEERTLELEKKMNNITEERLKYLEKLQHEQEQWKSQYFQTIKKMNEANYSVPPIVSHKANCYCLDSATDNHNHVQNRSNRKVDILKTPLPRKNIPQPTCSEQLGNGKFLRDILDQYSASTPNMSVSKNMGPIDTVPVRLSVGHDQANGNMNSIVVPPSPIGPSKQEVIKKEIEDEAERKKISEKFPISFSEYLPIAHMSPVSQILVKTVPHSSVVADYRQKLRKLMEMRSNLENNLQAAQKKPQLDNIATAALLEQLDDDDWLAIGNEKLCWIQKLVDEQIALNATKVKEEVANELKNLKSMNSKQLVSNKYKRNSKLKKLEEPKKPVKPKPKKIAAKLKVESYVKPNFEGADESTVTHIYGKAEYHPHRTTVHNPFMHISPIKSPKFRTKRALQAVPASYVRSNKTQTYPSPTLTKSKYLAPTAISLAPPCIHENDPDPIVVECPKPVVVRPKPCPLQKVEIVCCPCCNGCGCPCCSDCYKDVKCDAVVECVLSPKCPSPKKISPCIIRKTKPICKKVCEPIGPVCEAENVKCWVEQEIMAKILTQLYPCVPNQNTQTANVGDICIKNLIENELRSEIQQRLMQCCLKKEKRPTSPSPIVSQALLPTPQPTPSVSEAELSIASQRSIKTPWSAETSVSECVCTIPETSQSPEPFSPKEDHEVMYVPTPQETPVPSPEVSEKEATPEPVKSELNFTDPWEGKPPNADLLLQTCPKVINCFGPEPDPKNLVIRTITPPKAPEKVSFSSESSTSESTFNTEDRSISQGQFLIEHGEMKPKKRLPFEVPSNLEDLVNQSTLRDVADIDPISEGEFRPNVRPPIIPRKPFNYVEDDPTSIYARPRHPGMKTPEPDELSVGEIPNNKRRSRFERWKASKQTSVSSLVEPTVGNNAPSVANIPQDAYDDPLAINDLNSTSIDSASLSEGLAPNVIRVTSATPRTLEEFRNNPLGRNPDPTPKDSLDDVLHLNPRSQMNLVLPTTDPLSGTSDTEDISAPTF